MDDQKSMLVQPTSGKDNQLLTIGAPGDLVTHRPNESAALVLGHPPESKGFAGYLLVVE